MTGVESEHPGFLGLPSLLPMQLLGWIDRWLLATWSMILESAPWLLVGLFLAGIIRTLLPESVVEKYLTRPGFRSVLLASLFGVPLPLCSCSVIPVSVALRRRGASRGATASFMVSTPEIGIDSFLLSYVLLGPMLAWTRVLAAFCSALSAGWLIDLLDTESNSPPAKAAPASCCAHESSGAEEHTHSVQLQPQSVLQRILVTGFRDTVSDLALYLPVGFLLAGAVSAFVPGDFFVTSGLGVVAATLIMLVVSFPTYVCATSSTPLAASLIEKGLYPGAAMVFLLAGPASNIATMMAIASELGRKALGIYLFSIAGVSLLTAWIVTVLLPGSFKTGAAAQTIGHVHDSAINRFAAFALILLLLFSLMERLRKNTKMKSN